MPLFITEKRKPVYPTVASELAAVARGAKTIAFFASDARELDDDLAPITKLALRSALVTTVAARGEGVDIFVHRAGARIAPLQKLLSASPWTFAREAQLGRLLGYSATQRAAWMAAERHAYAGYGGVTHYALVPAGKSPRTTKALWFTQRGKVIDLRAVRTIEPGLVMWRVALRGDTMVSQPQRLTSRGWR